MTYTTCASLVFFYAKLTNSRAKDSYQIGNKEMKYKCKCKEFKLAKTTSIIVNGKIETAEAFCEECKTFG